MKALVLLAATVTTGLLAGLYYSYAISVMPALGRSDDRVLVDVMQRINVVIVNPWFMVSFLGAPLLTVAAAVVLGRDALWWVVAAAVCNIVATVVTFAFNIPLNDRLDAAGDPTRIADLAGVRDSFYGAWVRWNIVRMLLHTAAFGALAWALIAYGRQSS